MLREYAVAAKRTGLPTSERAPTIRSPLTDRTQLSFLSVSSLFLSLSHLNFVRRIGLKFESAARRTFLVVEIGGGGGERSKEVVRMSDTDESGTIDWNIEDDRRLMSHVLLRLQDQ